MKSSSDELYCCCVSSFQLVAINVFSLLNAEWGTAFPISVTFSFLQDVSQVISFVWNWNNYFCVIKDFIYALKESIWMKSNFFSFKWWTPLSIVLDCSIVSGIWDYPSYFQYFYELVSNSTMIFSSNLCKFTWSPPMSTPFLYRFTLSPFISSHRFSYSYVVLWSE
jgi:hypothetical protein